MSERTKPSVREAVAVEGRYDKNTLLQIVDALVIEMNGFSVFHNREKLQALCSLAQERGLVILTDSDPAGSMIRHRLAGQIPQGRVLHAYIPELPGRERRKRHDSAYGALGVEGMKPEVILQALRDSGAVLTWPEGDQASSDHGEQQGFATADFYALGLSGKPDSAELRSRLALTAGLPRSMNQRDLRKALGFRMTRTELEQCVNALRKEIRERDSMLTEK